MRGDYAENKRGVGWGSGQFSFKIKNRGGGMNRGGEWLKVIMLI